MKKILPIIIVLLVLIVAFLLKSNDKEQTDTVLGDELKLIDYNNGNGALVFNFLESKTERSKLSLAIDSDNNGTFEDNEWLVRDVLVLPKANKKNKVYFKAPDFFSGNQNVLVNLNDESLSKSVAVTISDTSTLLELGTITNPEEAMKGLGVKLALAEDELVEITQEGVPDITQKPGECGPTSAANGLISLINKHGEDKDKPASPEELIEELKKDMKWTNENGVLRERKIC